MAYKIINFDGTITPISTTYPYGQIKDDPSGTRANVKSNGDIQQFFQRMAANAGIVLNGTPDNADDGFQFVQALNALICNPNNALANVVGASGLTPVLVSGMVFTAGLPNTVSAGYFYYNGQYVYFQGYQYSNTPVGQSLYIKISSQDGQPVATGEFLNNGTADSSGAFLYSHLVPYSSALLDTTWTTLTPGSGWSAGSVATQCRKNQVGTVWLRGNVVLSTSGLTLTSTLPVGYRPTAPLILPCYTLTSGAPVIKSLGISTAGVITASTGTFGSGDVWYLDGITFLNS